MTVCHYAANSKIICAHYKRPPTGKVRQLVVVDATKKKEWPKRVQMEVKRAAVERGPIRKPMAKPHEDKIFITKT